MRSRSAAARTAHALVIAVALAAALVPAAVPAAAVSARPTTSSPRLVACDLGVGRPTRCGSIRVPLDPTDPRAGTIAIGFGWIPAAHATGTVVTQEGGPGYPSTGTAPDYSAMLGRTTENILVVDARGTGRSTPINCEPLQSLPSPSPKFIDAVTRCGQQLNHTFPRAGGGWVHASDLFTTANSARDLALVLEALELTKVDLYGDSYGTYFAQSFLSRYPGVLRSVVMDSAYEARDLDPWYRTTVSTARTAFDTVCRRTPGCPPGSSWTRIGQLAVSLRQRPIHGLAPDVDDGLSPVTVDVTALVNIVNDAGYDRDPYRQLDAAARAYLEHRDATPLLRLYAQDLGYDYGDYVGQPPSYFSDGLFMAVACTDYPQLFDMRSSESTRQAQLAASIRALPADTFAPFSTAEWLQVLPYTEAYTACLTWPAPTHRADPPIPPGPIDPDGIPVLIMNGELDSLTPAAGGAHIGRQIGPAAQVVVAANTVHLVALDNPFACGPSLVQAFLARPGRISTGCAPHVPAIHGVTQFPGVSFGLTPAEIAREAATDALARFNYIDGYTDRGLRGGTISYNNDGDATLTKVRWTVDTTVSGHVDQHGGQLTVTTSAGGSTVVTL